MLQLNTAMQLNLMKTKQQNRDALKQKSDLSVIFAQTRAIFRSRAARNSRVLQVIIIIIIIIFIRGKAAGLDELTIEHLANSHPVLVATLSKFFNLIVSAAYVLYGLRLSYTVPIPKEEQSHKGNSVDNYRAISISPIISKIFQHCILSRYEIFW